MRTTKRKIENSITQQLAALGASKIPAAARSAIDADIVEFCDALIKKRINRDYIGRMVTAGLAAAKEGSKGEAQASPLASNPSRTPKGAQMDVAGPASASSDASSQDRSNGGAA